ncbi:hypothetical protein [Variovorax sp. DT-64]|uniref:hypothetical protein n=1 Tax=Variovorax sp. DT-64 TaxID=3396160 RepID=UPI003F1BC020
MGRLRWHAQAIDEGKVARATFFFITKPDEAMEANWLPASKGPFVKYMHLYSPKEEALEATWIAPPPKLEA